MLKICASSVDLLLEKQVKQIRRRFQFQLNQKLDGEKIDGGGGAY